jgi:hypothetical protein
MKKLKFLLLSIVLVLLLSSCQNTVVNIPSGYVAKTLTPTGFDTKILSPGQVDIGIVGNNGQYSSLVLLEASTITTKESFGQSHGNTDKEDHRVMTKTTPLTVDIYVQMAIPKDVTLRHNAFSSITPKPTEIDRVSVIKLEDVYTRFAKMTVRGKVRGIFSKYNDWTDVMNNYDKVNAEIGLMVIQVFRNSHVPLELISVQLSNVKEDQRIWDSKNEQEAALQKVKSIEAIGAAMRNNPGYIQIRKWEVLEKIIESPNSAKISLIVSDDKSPNYTIPVK